MNDVQKQLFQRVIQKLIARNQCTPSEIENMQKLLDNVRDTKNFHMIMEKLKECGQIELDSFEENFKEGALVWNWWVYYELKRFSRRWLKIKLLGAFHEAFLSFLYKIIKPISIIFYVINSYNFPILFHLFLFI